MHYSSLNPQKALIWRIVHRDNIPWILDNGLHCGNSPMHSPAWVHIGNPDLTDKRGFCPVPAGQGGYLNDYVPFYFTPFSPMMRNIHTGWGGIRQRANDEMVILVSNLPKLREMGLHYVFTDGHAYYAWSKFYTDLRDLDKIDWPIIQSRDFKRDPNDPGKFERYQAEALIYQHCPVAALDGMICYNEQTRNLLNQWLVARQIAIPVHARPTWYFS